VSTDVPLAQPSGELSPASGELSPASGELSPASAAPERPAWHRFLWLWDWYFAVVAVVTLAAIHAEPAAPADRAAAAAAVVALAGWYLGFGRRLVHRVEPRRLAWRITYQVVVVGLLFGAASLVGSSALVMFALVPQALMTLPLVPAVASVLALVTVTWAAPATRAEGPVPLTLVPDQLLLILLVIVISVYINRIAQQSSERAQLIEKLNASRAEVARLSHEAGVAAERQRLAGDIHDTIAQGLASVVMLVQSADAAVERDPPAARQHLSLALRTARDHSAEARALVAALTPAPLDGASLPQALQRLAAGSPVTVTVDVVGTPRPLPTAVEVVLLRAAQESLTNVGKHAQARRVDVRLAYGQEAVTLEVRDDGIGFDTGQLGDGYGLGAMRARVEQVAGEVEVDSTPGVGTTVRVSVPA
jgi:signal transduction histidine kinase